MAGAKYPGLVVGDIIEVRFASSGKVTHVAKRAGDTVTTGQLLAILDQKILQMELDKQLADYERTRAEFEIFVRKLGEPQTDIAKFQKTQIQAELNASVKAVEIAKYRLDQTGLISPVSGVIINDGLIRPGLNITPASNSYKILDSSSLRFQIQIGPDSLVQFTDPKQVVITVHNREFPGNSQAPIFTGKIFVVDIPLVNSGLSPGLTGIATIPK